MAHASMGGIPNYLQRQIDTKGGGGAAIIQLTQSEYAALPESEKLREDVIYDITDDNDVDAVTDQVTEGSEALITSGGVYSAFASNLTGLILSFSNISVTTSSFVEDTTYSDYPYKADIACTGVTSNYIPTVNFDCNDAISGIFAPIAKSGAGIVTIYSSEVPASTITIPTIVCVKGGA